MLCPPDIAYELGRRCDLQMCELLTSLSDLVNRHDAPDRRQLTLGLA